MGTLNVLIGANGAGKSTLLEAINFSRRAIMGDSISRAARRYAPFGHDFFNYYDEGYTAEFDLDIQTKNNAVYKYHFAVSYDPDVMVREDFRVYSEKLMKHVEGGSGDELVFDRKPRSKTVSYENRHGEQATIEIEANRLFLATLASPATREIVDTISSFNIMWSDGRMDSSELKSMVVDNPASASTIDDVAVSLSLKDESAFDGAVQAIKKIIPEFEAPRITNLSDIDGNTMQASQVKKEKSLTDYRYFVNWLDSRHQGSAYSRYAISGGNLKVIYLILSLYNTESKSCLIAEEIENGMHPARVRKLVQTIISIARNRKIQLVFSTHSYLLTSEILPQDIIFCEYKDGEGAKYRRLTETDEYSCIKQALGLEPSTEDVLNSGLFFDDNA
jgi:AAA15 family ATPase/GTPase